MHSNRGLCNHFFSWYIHTHTHSRHVCVSIRKQKLPQQYVGGGAEDSTVLSQVRQGERSYVRNVHLWTKRERLQVWVDLQSTTCAFLCFVNFYIFTGLQPIKVTFMIFFFFLGISDFFWVLVSWSIVDMWWQKTPHMVNYSRKSHPHISELPYRNFILSCV